jgi:hypothetical protein
MAVRVPSAKVAGTVARRLAIFPNRPDVCRSILRSMSPGTRVSSSPTTIARPARTAGIRVPESGASPERTWVLSRMPKITSAAM